LAPFDADIPLYRNGFLYHRRHFAATGPNRSLRVLLLSRLRRHLQIHGGRRCRVYDDCPLSF
jgi:hypothetical protein